MSFDSWFINNYNDILNLYNIFYNNMKLMGFNLENDKNLLKVFSMYLYENTN